MSTSHAVELSVVAISLTNTLPFLTLPVVVLRSGVDVVVATLQCK